MPESGAVYWLAFTANGALFPLMALFIWLDVSYYRPYLPLFIAGKCIGILSLVGWLIVFIQGNIFAGLSNAFAGANIIFLCGDLLALAVILLIFWDTQKLAKSKHIETQDYGG
jgi:hypothetical protein